MKPYVVCFECGDRWSRLALRRRYIAGWFKGAWKWDRPRWRADDFHLSYWQWFTGSVTIVLRPCRRIHFCPECLHDF